MHFHLEEQSITFPENYFMSKSIGANKEKVSDKKYPLTKSKLTGIKKDVNVLAKGLADMESISGKAKDEIDTVKNKLDSLNEMGEMESLRLQMTMDRVSKFMSTLSNILKKMSDTQQGIVQNMK